MANVIKYIPKQTAAKTQYREISDQGLDDIQMEMLKWTIRMGQLDQHSEDDLAALRDIWWHRKTKKLHAGKQGRNTPCSTVTGILDNFLFKSPPQRDLSDKQCEDIEWISSIISTVFDDCEQIRFQVGFES